jgi:hypothetical protein
VLILEARVTRPGLALLATMAATWPQAFAAQALDQPGNSVRVGDQWTYSRKNEITGIPGNTYTATVTEITPQEIVTSNTAQGKEEEDLTNDSFDHDWNAVASGPWRYKPHDGPGIHLPLEVGKEWRFEYFQINVRTNARFKVSSITKVLGRESVTTPAGSFDAFKIERQARAFNIAAPSIVSESQVVLWYAPEVNRWVRRTSLTKLEKRTRSKTSEELTAFSRKE